MSGSEFATLPPPPEPVTANYDAAGDVAGLILADHLRDAIWTAEATTARSLQSAVGWSEIGDACRRKLAYSLAGASHSNYPDPLKAMVGTGGHLVLAEHFRRLDAGTGRYLVEQKLTYRGVPGTVDLVDCRRRAVIDWKFKPLAKIKRLRREGVPNYAPGYVIQAHGYGTALVASGVPVDQVGLAFVPTDGELDDIWVWHAPLDQSIANEAVDQLDALRGTAPQNVPARPGPLCGWCPYYREGWAGDMSSACPGLTKGRK